VLTTGREAKGQALAGALPLPDTTAHVVGPAGARGQIHHLFKSVE